MNRPLQARALCGTHDERIVDQMRKRLVELEHGKVVRDQERGVYDAGEA